MYQRIVVPLDGSRQAERALAEAESLARIISVPMHIVRVVDLSGMGAAAAVAPYIDALTYQILVDDEQDAAHDYGERLKRDLAGRGLPVTFEIRQGPAAQEVLAATRPGDLVVMATHGRGGLERWFMGSVAESIVRRSEVPVLLIREPSDEGHPEH